MPWMSESDNQTPSDNVFLQYPNKLAQSGDKTEVRIRVLAGDPVDPSVPAGVWVHWVDQKPYNCARPSAQCPLCDIRSAAMKESPEAARKQYPMRTKSFFNVLTTENGRPSVKVFSFGHAVSKNLKEFSEKYGDLRDYDITVRKTQTGRLAMNVEYSVFFEGKRELSPEEAAAAKNLHDLSGYVEPGNAQTLSLVAREAGLTSQPVANDSERADELIKDIRAKIPSDIDLKHFGIDVDRPQIDKLEALLSSLRGE